MEDLLYEGLVFQSEEEAYASYNSYARKIGFSIRKDKIYYRADRTVRRRFFVCFKEGVRKKDKRNENVKNDRNETRIGCKARMAVSNVKNEWVVTEVIHKHNHELATPSKTYLLRSQRRVKEPQGAEISSLDAAGIAPIDGYKYMTHQAGGLENVGFTYIDYKNYLRKKREQELGKHGDGNAIIEYFKRKKAENPSFFYDELRDDENQLSNMFWTDATSVMDYNYFGDVVVFYTTYRTNKYGRPFAPFVGVNHHMQSIIFGGALLIDESAESFKWLFKTFLKAMSGKPPKTILTDQCPAMAKAIPIVFPETQHRLCLWHIYLNAGKHLHHVYRVPGFLNDFNKCVYNCETEDIFLSRWDKMLHDYDLLENKWLVELIKIKKKWALVYGRDIFCADMTTTQRGESTNSLLKNYVKRKYSLTKFVHRFECLLQSRRQAEIEADFNSSQMSQRLFVSTPMLKQASDMYTHAVFEIFEVEYKEHLMYNIKECNVDGTTYTYEVTREGSVRKVAIDMSNFQTECSCKKFESLGLICRHILKVFYHNNIHTIPNQYILQRWTKAVKVGVVRDNGSKPYLSNCNAVQSLRYNELCHLAMKLVTKGAVNENGYLKAKDALQKGLEEVEQDVPTKEIYPRQCSKSKRSGVATNVEENDDEVLVVASGSEKGRPMNGTRPKGVLELKKKKKQTSTTQVPSKKIKRNKKEQGDINIAQGLPDLNESVHPEENTIGTQYSQQCSLYQIGGQSQSTNMWGLSDLNECVHPEDNTIGTQYSQAFKFEEYQLPPRRRLDFSNNESVLLGLSGSPDDLDSFSFQELLDGKFDLEDSQIVSNNDDKKREEAKRKLKRNRKKKKKNIGSEIILKNEDLEHKWENILRDFNPLICDMIKDLAEVTPDGHCGYRSIATLLGYTDDLAWRTVRGLMLEELMQYADYYTELYGNDGFENYKRNLECTKSSTMNEKEWLDLPDMGSLVASAFNVVFVTIAPPKLCVTYFPLRTGPEEIFRIIAVCHINEGTHFVPVVLKDNAPLPPVCPGWQSVRWPEATMWETVLKGKLDKWAGSVPTNMQKLQYVYLD